LHEYTVISLKQQKYMKIYHNVTEYVFLIYTTIGPSFNS